MRLAIETFGTAGPSVLLLHGITSNAAGWWRVGADLAAAGLQVTAPDLRGHGRSGPAESYRFSEHVTDLMELGDHWDVVLGHSMGGGIAVLAAESAPGWTDGLILQDPAIVMPSDVGEVIRWLLDDYQRPITSERIATESPRWDPRDVDAKVKALRAASPEMVEATIRENWPWMLLEEAASLEVATVIIGSDPATGGLLPITIGEWLADLNRHVSYGWIEGSSHSTHRDADMYETYRKTLTEALALLPTLR